MNKLSGRETFALGFMAFALFLGSGNIIFPPFIGLKAGSNVWSAAAGLERVCTGALHRGPVRPADGLAISHRRRAAAELLPITLTHLKKLQQCGDKIAMLTRYDATFVRELSTAGVEMLLIGDTLGMILQGHD